MEFPGLLPEVGRRLRAAREAVGLSVTEAALSAGVSRRHWTETEAGRANPSLLVLARQAQAVGASLAALVDVSLSRRSFERLALVGLRGAGKTTVGRALALELEVPFVQLDQRIEELAGLDLGQIFDLHGPEVFQRFEAEALETVLARGERVVLETGGSIVASEAVFRRLRTTCHTVWLRARPEEHFLRVLQQGDRRPMRNHPRAMEELREILSRREPLYEQCELTVETSEREPSAIVAELLDWWRRIQLLDPANHGAL